jgi:hypothetical protein
VVDEMFDNSPNEYSGEEAYRWLHSRIERVMKGVREELRRRGTDLVVVSIGIDRLAYEP